MSIRFLAALAGALLLGAPGCDSGASPGPDGSPLRDAALVDGGGLLDGGASGDAGAPAADAGAADAGPALCVATECDPRSPDGCSEGRCVLWSDAASCELDAGALGPGAECTELGQCAPGLACFRQDGVGVCGRICCPSDGSTCAEDARCGGSGALVDGTETSWGRCLPPRACDLLDPSSACEEREGCYIVDATGTTECRVAGRGDVGASCEEPEDCKAGFFCGGLSPVRRCVRICRIGEDDCPEAEGRCVDPGSHTPEGVGVCTLDTAGARWNAG
jgi:hypothetical protein